MTHINDLVEQHILEHESRLKHIDELLQRAQQAKGEESEQGQLIAELTALTQDRKELANYLETLKQDPVAHWQKSSLEKAGPLGIWDAVAQRLEGLVEQLEGKK